MEFLSSTLAAFIGAFFAVYLKHFFEMNKYIIRIHEETHLQLTKANNSIFKKCLTPYNDQFEFEPPDIERVENMLRNFFDNSYIRYTGYYPPSLQQSVDELRGMYIAVDSTFTTRNAYMTPYGESSKLHQLLSKIARMCEEEVTLRRTPLKHLLHTFCSNISALLNWFSNLG